MSNRANGTYDKKYQFTDLSKSHASHLDDDEKNTSNTTQTTTTTSTTPLNNNHYHYQPQQQQHHHHHHHSGPIDDGKFHELMQKHNISGFFSRKLKNLHSFKIVFILDDSGSMNKQLEESPLNKNSYKATRWDELQEFIKISIEIANAVNPDGCDVYFLNRRMVKNVKKPEEISSSFKKKPSGFTPITKRLTTVLRNNMPNVLNDKKLLVVIVTDGEPTSPEGK